MSEGNQNNKRSDATGTSEKKKIGIAYIVIAVLAVALIGVTVYFLWPRAEEAPPTDRRETVIGGKGSILTQENREEERKMLDETHPDGQYTVSMTTNWLFETAKTPSRNAIVNNLEENTRTVYFDVTLKDTNELVYSSPYIPLGETLQDFALDEDLSAGVYDAIVTFFLVDDDHEIVTDVSVSVTITIEK